MKSPSQIDKDNTKGIKIFQTFNLWTDSTLQYTKHGRLMKYS